MKHAALPAVLAGFMSICSRNLQLMLADNGPQWEVKLKQQHSMSNMPCRDNQLYRAVVTELYRVVTELYIVIVTELFIVVGAGVTSRSSYANSRKLLA